VSVRTLAPYGRVNTVEPSHANPAVAYAAIDRHLLGDRRPYLFTTTDYGRTWRSIVAGLPSDDFVRVVREDPRNPAVLYAGLEGGVYVSFNGGARWRSLQIDLPHASVRDLQIQPVADDLIAGTHGRSLWILDDLTPLQQLARAVESGQYLFPLRPAYEFQQWFDEQAGIGSQPPLGDFGGENPPYGALISYYLARAAATAPRIVVTDAGGRVVRHLGGDDVTNHAGINRLAWDLTEDAPVAWQGTPKWNRGPSGGPQVIPGQYTVRLYVDGRTLQQVVDVRADPRARWTQADYVRRHLFLAQLADRFSRVDAALNEIDRLRAAVGRRRALLVAPGSGALRAALAAFARDLQAVRSGLTSDPQNMQDDDFLPDRLREQLQAVIGLVDMSLANYLGYGGLYVGPPTVAHEREAARVNALYAERMAAYQKLVDEELPAINRRLAAAKLAPL